METAELAELNKQKIEDLQQQIELLQVQIDKLNEILGVKKNVNKS